MVITPVFWCLWDLAYFLNFNFNYGYYDFKFYKCFLEKINPFWWFTYITNCLRILYIKIWSYLSSIPTPPSRSNPHPIPTQRGALCLQNSLSPVYSAKNIFGVSLSTGVRYTYKVWGFWLEWYIYKGSLPKREPTLSSYQFPVAPPLRVGLPASLLQGFPLAWAFKGLVHAVPTTVNIHVHLPYCVQKTLSW